MRSLIGLAFPVGLFVLAAGGVAASSLGAPVIVSYVVWTIFALCVFGTGLAAWNQLAVRRTKWLAVREPDAIVYMSTPTPQLFAGLESLALDRGVEITPPVFGVTLVASRRGIEFWSGWGETLAIQTAGMERSAAN